MSSSLTEPWLRGVAANAAAPSGVLLRLLHPAARAAWQVLCRERALPSAVVDAVIAHPEPALRRAFARSHYATAAQRSPLVDDPDAFVLSDLASGPQPRRERVEPLPDDVVETLLTRQDDPAGGRPFATADDIRHDLVYSRQISVSYHRAMPAHRNPGLRVQAAGRWLWLTPGQREALLADPEPSVRDAARRHSRVLDPAAMEAELPEADGHMRSLMLLEYAVSHAVAEACLAQGRDLWSLAHNRHTPADVVARLAHDPDPRVRACVAGRADLGRPLLDELARDPDDAVRTRARAHPLPRTWPQRHALDRVFGLATEDIGPFGEMRVEPDSEWYGTCAASEHPLLRRVAATCPGLPEHLVRRLADDPDEQVRHLLACNHPLAPPRIVLDAFVAIPRGRPYLLTLSRLPRTGLRHLLGHGDPEVRGLAAGDPTLGGPPVDLLTDTDAGVRRAAAANPLLPADLIATLLDRPATAEGAAANPGLSAERLHELLDRAGLPRGGQ
ncbi:hypothetical protein [Streptomyces fructofermentans]|uniref:LRV domain-containing protein n=1 Tax=Streptomyces fructofermentans TaxID=152141 RepID=A0A918K2I3_9ACTN|nr:hypothetical protein [Streptomyces fructofermentans]GGX41596.1 hypothetical protein GCM10010515_05700 [Streptomyces fructofermentans]